MTGFNPHRQAAGTSKGGQFAPGDAGREEAEVDDLFGDDMPSVEHCPLCGQVIDYCQGHGEWNSSEKVTADSLRIGDRVMDEGLEYGTVTGLHEDHDDVMATFDSGDEVRFSPKATVHALEAEDNHIRAIMHEMDVSHVAYREDPGVGVWNSTIIGPAGQLHTIERGPRPNPVDIVEREATAARAVNGKSYDEFARSIGYEPEDDVAAEYNEAISRANNVLSVFGEDGYRRVVFGDGDAEMDIPLPVEETEE